MRIQRQIDLVFICLIVIAILFFFVPQAFAGGDIIQSNDNNNQTSGDVSVSGDDSMALGFSGGPGDVDLSAPCLYSVQGGGLTFFRQKVRIDHVCRAIQFLDRGLYEIAAIHFCFDEMILSRFNGDTNACEAAYDFTPQEKPVEEPVTMRGEVLEHVDDHEALDQQQAEEIATLRQDYDNLLQRLNRPRIERPPLFTDEQRAEILGLKIEDEE
jgi:hypothetical protein